MTWKRKKKHKWLDSLDEADKPTPSPITRRKVTRHYVPKGKKLWPLLSITVGPKVLDMNPLIGFSVYAAIKDGADDWWVECGVPNELADEVGEMLKKYIKKIEGRRTDYEALMREEMEKRRAKFGSHVGS